MINVGRLKTFLLLILFNICYSDDASIGTEGGNVYPIFNTNVQMIKERIKIKITKNDINTTCKFWFVNKGPEDNIGMGFPALEESPSSGNKLVRNFKCYHNGKEIKTSLANSVTTWDNDSRYKEIKKWYSWYIEMGEGDTCLIVNKYKGDFGVTNWGWESVHYTISTGATWDGPILDGRICFDHSQLASTRFIPDKTFKHIDKSKIKIEFSEDSTVFSFKNYKPQRYDSFKLYFIAFWESFYCNMPDKKIWEYIKTQCINGIELSKEDWRLMRNEVFAHHGYVFKDESLNKYFESRPWYKKNPSFHIESLNCYEKSLVDLIKNKEEGAH